MADGVCKLPKKHYLSLQGEPKDTIKRQNPTLIQSPILASLTVGQPDVTSDVIHCEIQTSPLLGNHKNTFLAPSTIGCDCQFTGNTGDRHHSGSKSAHPKVGSAEFPFYKSVLLLF